MKLSIGPVGAVSKGHILDVAKKPFERALRDLDPLLYVKWNPKKLQKHGCWEIRRKPEFYTIQDIGETPEFSIVKIGPVEFDFIHHVLDCAFLNYDQIRKLKEMDTFAYGPTKEQATKNWINNLDTIEADRARRLMAEAKANKDYAAKHYRKELRELKNAVLSGWNPASIADAWDKVGKLD